MPEPSLSEERLDAAIRRLAEPGALGEDEGERLRAVRTLLAEETRIGMLVGVAVGWALRNELTSQEEETN